MLSENTSNYKKSRRTKAIFYLVSNVSYVSVLNYIYKPLLWDRSNNTTIKSLERTKNLNRVV